MNIGIRAHDIDNQSLDELVQKVADKGLTSVQLALSKSLKDINTDLGCLSSGFAKYIGNEFSKQHIQIAVLGCYFNMIHPDHMERRRGIERFKEHIRYARDFGCSIVATETGNINAEIYYTEENFKEGPFLEVVKSVRELVEEAEKFGIIVGIEAGVNHPVYSSKVMKRLLNTIDSNNLQVILDPVNLLTIDTYKRQEDIFLEAFELLGDRIAILHAKDFIIENNKLIPIAVGKGLLNYDFILKTIKKKKPFIHILLEETKEPYIDDSVRYLKEKYQQV